jgi:hypothetical protein
MYKYDHDAKSKQQQSNNVICNQAFENVLTFMYLKTTITEMRFIMKSGGGGGNVIIQFKSVTPCPLSKTMKNMINTMILSHVLYGSGMLHLTLRDLRETSYEYRRLMELSQTHKHDRLSRQKC